MTDLLIWGVSSCDGRAVRNCIHARHLLSNDAALQPSMDGRYLGLLPKQLLKGILSHLHSQGTKSGSMSELRQWNIGLAVQQESVNVSEPPS